MRNIDFNKYQSALIIGNGFDLSLGLSTSYMDFVNSDEFQILLNMQNQLAIYLKVNAELHYKENGYHCMMQQLDSLTHNSLTSFRQYNRVNFINTDKEKVFI